MRLTKLILLSMLFFTCLSKAQVNCRKVLSEASIASVQDLNYVKDSIHFSQTSQEIANLVNSILQKNAADPIHEAFIDLNNYFAKPFADAETLVAQDVTDGNRFDLIAELRKEILSFKDLTYSFEQVGIATGSEEKRISAGIRSVLHHKELQALTIYSKLLRKLTDIENSIDVNNDLSKGQPRWKELLKKMYSRLLKSPEKSLFMDHMNGIFKSGLSSSEKLLQLFDLLQKTPVITDSELEYLIENIPYDGSTEQVSTLFLKRLRKFSNGAWNERVSNDIYFLIFDEALNTTKIRVTDDNLTMVENIIFTKLKSVTNTYSAAYVMSVHKYFQKQIQQIREIPRS